MNSSARMWGRRQAAATTWLAFMACCLMVDTASAAPRSPSFLRTCIIAAPDPTPIFGNPAAGAPDDDTSDDDADDSDDDEDDEDDEDDDQPHGFVSPGSGACIAISGTVNFGIQRDWFTAGRIARATGLVPPNATSFPLTTTFRIETAQTLANGLYLATAFETSTDLVGGVGEPTITEATVSLGAWVFGRAGSRFDFWTGDDFVFVSRVPNRTVNIIAYQRALTDSLQISLSAEDVDADVSAIPALSGGRRIPDGIARLLYDNGELTLHGAVALRDVSATALSSARLGRAAIIGATWERSILGRPTNLTAQIAGGIDAAPYLGSQMDRRTVRTLIFGDDATRGWSGVVSLRRDWTDTISTSVYASRYELRLPQGIRSGRISIDRASANLTWTPLDGVRTGIEASIGWQKAQITNQTAAIALAGRQASLQIFLERGF